jgi:hypothetical protein
MLWADGRYAGEGLAAWVHDELGATLTIVRRPAWLCNVH